MEKEPAPIKINKSEMKRRNPSLFKKKGNEYINWIKKPDHLLGKILIPIGMIALGYFLYWLVHQPCK